MAGKCEVRPDCFSIQGRSRMNPDGFTAIFHGCENPNCPMEFAKEVHMEFNPKSQGKADVDRGAGTVNESQAKKIATEKIRTSCARHDADTSYHN